MGFISKLGSKRLRRISVKASSLVAITNYVSIGKTGSFANTIE